MKTDTPETSETNRFQLHCFYGKATSPFYVMQCWSWQGQGWHDAIDHDVAGWLMAFSQLHHMFQVSTHSPNCHRAFELHIVATTTTESRSHVLSFTARLLQKQDLLEFGVVSDRKIAAVRNRNPILHKISASSSRPWQKEMRTHRHR